MNRYLRAWAMRWFNLTPTECVAGLRERNEDLEEQISQLRTDLGESDNVRKVLQMSVEVCRKRHWKGALALALLDNLKTNSQGE